jgi:pyroglutamyl-peptidase
MHRSRQRPSQKAPQGIVAHRGRAFDIRGMLSSAATVACWQPMTENPRILLTGFEPYGGLPSNPAAETVDALDGKTIAGFRLVGRALPVSLERISAALAAAIDEIGPSALLSLGLCPGEAAIRLERVGLNLADFALADNDGATRTDQPLIDGGVAARMSSLPLRAIERALLDAGTPARISETAGTYLCNACLYLSLALIERHGLDIPCGFIHLPMTPELAAHAMTSGAASAFDRGVPASMELSRIIAAVRISITETAIEIQRTVARNPGRSSVT